jgi:hypothetical protein
MLLYMLLWRKPNCRLIKPNIGKQASCMYTTHLNATHNQIISTLCVEKTGCTYCASRSQGK